MSFIMKKITFKEEKISLIEDYDISINTVLYRKFKNPLRHKFVWKRSDFEFSSDFYHCLHFY